MRLTALIAAACCLLTATPALAQEAAGPSERARELAARYVELMDLAGVMRDQMVGVASLGDEALAGAVALNGEPKGPGSGPSAAMPGFVPETSMEALGPMIEFMESLMIDAVAETYPEAELEALLAFYDSDVGRSILGRQGELNVAMSARMMERMPEMMQAMGLGDLTGGEEGATAETFDLDAWVDPTPPLVRQMSPAL